jgi:hypothetical protein
MRTIITRSLVGLTMALSATPAGPEVELSKLEVISLTENEQEALDYLELTLTEHRYSRDLIPFFMAVIHQESSTWNPTVLCNPKAVSKSGGAGPLQLMPATAISLGMHPIYNGGFLDSTGGFIKPKREYSQKLKTIAEKPIHELKRIDQRFDTLANLRAGTKYYHRLIHHYEGKVIPNHLEGKPITISGDSATGFAVVAYNLGVTATDRLLEKGFGTNNVDHFLELLNHYGKKHNGIKWYNRFRDTYPVISQEKIEEVTNYSRQIGEKKVKYATIVSRRFSSNIPDD